MPKKSEIMGISRLSYRPEFDFFKIGFFLAFVAEGVIEYSTQRPLLLILVPIGPSVARNGFSSATIANKSYAHLAFPEFCDCATVYRRVLLFPLGMEVNRSETDKFGIPMTSWTEAVEQAVRRHVANTGDMVFERQALIDAELLNIVEQTGSVGATPAMTLSRELQEMRDRGLLEFVNDRGTYRLL